MADLLTDLREFAHQNSPGTPLPGVRELSRRYSVGPATVQKAVRVLMQEGLLETHPGVGTFVTRPPAAVEPSTLLWQSSRLNPVPAGFLEQQDIDSFPGRAIPVSTGYLDASLQPTSQLAASAARVARKPQVWERMITEGSQSLRDHFAHELADVIHPNHILIVPGGQAALAALFRALVQPGETVLMESPTYVGVIAVAKASGAQLLPVPSDDQGLQPEQLDVALQRSGAKLVYCQPTYRNPGGISLSTARRMQVLEVVRRHQAFLIEDDANRDLTLEGHAPPPLFLEGQGHVIHIRSLTKSIASGLRVAAVAAQGPVIQRIRAARTALDLFVPGLMQEIALDFVTSSQYSRHLSRVRMQLRQRRNTLMTALRKHMPAVRFTVPTGGMNLWVQLPDGLDERLFSDRALQAGVHLLPGSRWFPGEAPGPFFRFSYGALPEPELVQAVQVLAGVLQEMT
ncbi:aminotransferase-like domain-containing protein [Deinococcus cellulosilyticus]|uniref:Putative transcriptional regulator, GntR family protein n=1 Tax=Deinococcus cellulosilyticus (strain DSM 18568 / NBRC 106333 / KACC 11606 / 5516J-15) TaxID=1223518 RepID=A0A511MV41_DEIC1|nr:PLP-dependent aminotransferase family protein [Deinococcus cellulosilyticus]GEM44453.1 putative transcriptional regulator, GntR family protein [Deinococcus cellulosilyticus NBRC 106333 = KACC 11606]